MPCCAWKCVPTAVFGGVYISEVPGCHLLWQMNSQWVSQKLLQGLVFHTYISVFNLFLTQWIIAVLSKGCKPDKFASHNSQKRSFTNIQGLHSSSGNCQSFLESNTPDILALCVTNLDDSTDSGNFSVSDCLPLMWKDSTTHMHGLAIYVKEGLHFAWDLSLKKTPDSTGFTSFLSVDDFLCLYVRFLILFHLT